MTHPMTTTTFTLDGYRIARTLGVVRGITLRSRSIFGTIGGSLQTLVGGNIALYRRFRENDTERGFDMMPAHARNWGPTPSSACATTRRNSMQGVTEVLCYGTAVVVAPEAESPPPPPLP